MEMSDQYSDGYDGEDAYLREADYGKTWIGSCALSLVDESADYLIENAEYVEVRVALGTNEVRSVELVLSTDIPEVVVDTAKGTLTVWSPFHKVSLPLRYKVRCDLVHLVTERYRATTGESAIANPGA